MCREIATRPSKMALAHFSARSSPLSAMISVGGNWTADAFWLSRLIHVDLDSSVVSVGGNWTVGVFSLSLFPVDLDSSKSMPDDVKSGVSVPIDAIVHASRSIDHSGLLVQQGHMQLAESGRKLLAQRHCTPAWFTRFLASPASQEILFDLVDASCLPGAPGFSDP